MRGIDTPHRFADVGAVRCDLGGQVRGRRSRVVRDRGWVCGWGHFGAETTGADESRRHEACFDTVDPHGTIDPPPQVGVLDLDHAAEVFPSEVVGSPPRERLGERAD